MAPLDSSWRATPIASVRKVLGSVLFVAWFCQVGVHAQEIPVEPLDMEFSDPDLSSGAAEDLWTDRGQLQWDETTAPIRPLDAMEVSLEELALLPGMDEFRASNLWHFLQRNGPPAHPNELRAVPGLDSLRIAALVKHYKLQPRLAVKTHRRWDWALRHTWTYHSTQARDLRASGQGGVPIAGRVRVEAAYGTLWNAGLLLETDAGERLGYNIHPNSPFPVDHWNGFIAWKAPPSKRSWWPSRLLLGHFQMETGQGMGLWTLPGFNAPAGSLMRHARGMRPYAGSDEDHGLLGIGVEWRSNLWKFEAYASSRSRDARLENGLPAALRSGGIHRSESERLGKDQWKADRWGGQVTYSGEKLRLSSGLHQQQLRPSNSEVKELVAKRSVPLWTTSWLIPWGAMRFYGEGALTMPDARTRWAWTTGIDWDLPSDVRMGLKVERSTPEFVVLSGQLLRDFKPAPQWNAYWNTTLGLGRGLRATAGILYRRIENEAPSAPLVSYQMMGALEWNLSRFHKVQFRAQTRLDAEFTQAEDSPFETIQEEARTNYILQWQWNPIPSQIWTFRHVRNQANNQDAAGGPSTHRGFGWALSSQFESTRALAERTEEKRWRCTLQAFWVYAPVWDNRIYFYEAGPPGQFSVPAYGGQSWGVNGLLRLALSPGHRLWVRLGRKERYETETRDRENPYTIQIQWDAHW
ncbi:hypothetical protein GC167_08125 [bacterium]|nr:hypothetical protein [bacterium]